MSTRRHQSTSKLVDDRALQNPLKGHLRGETAEGRIVNKTDTQRIDKTENSPGMLALVYPFSSSDPSGISKKKNKSLCDRKGRTSPQSPEMAEPEGLHPRGHTKATQKALTRRPGGKLADHRTFHRTKSPKDTSRRWSKMDNTKTLSRPKIGQGDIGWAKQQGVNFSHEITASLDLIDKKLGGPHR